MPIRTVHRWRPDMRIVSKQSMAQQVDLSCRKSFGGMLDNVAKAWDESGLTSVWGPHGRQLARAESLTGIVNPTSIRLTTPGCYSTSFPRSPGQRPLATYPIRTSLFSACSAAGRQSGSLVASSNFPLSSWPLERQQHPRGPPPSLCASILAVHTFNSLFQHALLAV
jgi:hypothetical protein